jgi:hypothetical protein
MLERLDRMTGRFPKSVHPCFFHPCKICLEGFFTLHFLLDGCHVDYLPKFDACSVLCPKCFSPLFVTQIEYQNLQDCWYSGGCWNN